MKIISTKMKPVTFNQEIAINITNIVRNNLHLQIDNDVWVTLSQEEILDSVHNHNESVLYKTIQKTGYTLYGSNPAYIDTDAKYYIYNFAKAFENQPIIVREDEKEYLGNKKWIVDFTNLIRLESN